MPWERGLRAGERYRRQGDQALERKLRWLVAGPGIRSAAARKVREKVREHYLWSRITREIESE